MKSGIEIRNYGRIKNGKLIFDTPDLYNQQVLALEGKDFVLTIKKRHERPTQSAYAYYFGVVLPTCYEANHFSHYDSKDQIHDEYFAPKFLSYRKIVDGKELIYIRSAADISKDEFSEFLTKVVAHAEVELQIPIPPPELAYNKYYNK